MVSGSTRVATQDQRAAWIAAIIAVRPMEHATHALGLLLASMLAGALVARSPLRLALAALLIASTHVLVLVGPGEPSYRFVVAVFAAFATMHFVDLVRDRRHWSWTQRVMIMLTPFDARRLRRAPGSVGLRLWATGSAFLVLALLAAAFAVHGGRLTGDSPATPLRLAAGLVAVYCLPEVLSAYLRAGYGMLGLRIPVLHRPPILSRTIGDLWGARWNLTVRNWLFTHLYLPVTKWHSSGAGLAVAFAGSAAIHAWLAAVSLDVRAALAWTAFFLVHGILAIVETRIGIERWRPAIARTWTLGWCVITSPLFVEPMIRIAAGPLG